MKLLLSHAESKKGKMTQVLIAADRDIAQIGLPVMHDPGRRLQGEAVLRSNGRKNRDKIRISCFERKCADFGC